MNKKELPKLTPPEFEIMDAIWQNGELSTGEIVKIVNKSKEKVLKRTTIQVQVNRLEEKGWLQHRKEGNKFLFNATVSREKASSAITTDIKERVFGGSCVDLVKSLFAGSSVSPKELKKIRELIDKYEGE